MIVIRESLNIKTRLVFRDGCSCPTACPSQYPSAYLRPRVTVRERRDEPVHNSFCLVLMFGHRDDRGFIFLHLADRLANTIMPSDIEIDDREGRRVSGEERSRPFGTRAEVYTNTFGLSGHPQGFGNFGIRHAYKH